MAIKRETVFFELLRAGLWEHDVRPLPYGEIDFTELLELAEEQSVVGLIAAGLEHVEDRRIARQDARSWVGYVLRLEQRNTAMNTFIASLIKKLNSKDICGLILKGQGVAQCYERPLWRASGDVDLFFSDDNYDKAKAVLIPLASSVEKEGITQKHLGMKIDQWPVELHGTLHCGLSSRVDRCLDEIKDEVFAKGYFRSWINGEAQVSLLPANEDAVYVFTHILQHFYKGGIGVRQLCDWCRLLWNCKDEIDLALMERRLKKMGLVSEWKAFGAFAVEYLGMPAEAMPLYSSRMKWKRKAASICSFIIEVGNFGHNRDSSYFTKYPYLKRKVISLGRRIGDLYRHARIFPLDSVRFLPRIVINGLRASMRGE